jgi:hypothetical protein
MRGYRRTAKAWQRRLLRGRHEQGVPGSGERRADNRAQPQGLDQLDAGRRAVVTRLDRLARSTVTGEHTRSVTSRKADSIPR